MDELQQVSGHGSVKIRSSSTMSAFATLNAAHGNGDGQPWDADYGDGTNYQYNYSHGNTASTIMFCGPQSINNTFRYNISQNEDMGPLDPAGNTGNCQVYNNTFYIKKGSIQVLVYSTF